VADYGEAKIWINLSKRDYTVASHLYTTLVPKPIEIICFHSQQTVEKALKAVLAYYEADIPRTHDIIALNKLCKEHTDKVQVDVVVAEAMTNFAVATRYVEDRRDYAEDTAEFALKQANLALEAVKQFLKKTEAENEAQQQEESPE
jgi:HEPN domain-containing protein